jgi:hypothetical protein
LKSLELELPLGAASPIVERECIEVFLQVADVGATGL